MKIKEKLRVLKTWFFYKIKQFYQDEFGGNLVEYALLIGFALFLFFTIVGIVTSMLDWTVEQSNGFWELFQG